MLGSRTKEVDLRLPGAAFGSLPKSICSGGLLSIVRREVEALRPAGGVIVFMMFQPREDDLGFSGGGDVESKLESDPSEVVDAWSRWLNHLR